MLLVIRGFSTTEFIHFHDGAWLYHLNTVLRE